MSSHCTSVFIAALLALAASTNASAQCPRWQQGPLNFPAFNPNGQVLAITSWDPDGAGPVQPLLVIGGTFTSVGGISANRIAAFNGFHWIPLGSGCNNTVLALGVFNNQLIAGGDFTTAGGIAANRIARWNGATWQTLGSGTSGGSPVGRVSALTVFNNELIAGGAFTSAGGVAANCIARWNGSSWNALGTGMAIAQNTPRVQCVASFNGQLYAGGFFTSAGGTSVNNIARWNGSSWNKLGLTFGGDGADGLVRCMRVHDFGGTLGQQLVIGGSFSSVSIGTITINSAAVARWSGSTWGGFAGGIAGATVAGLASDGTNFIAGGFFAGTFNSIARWNHTSSAWQAFNSGIDSGSVQCMTNFNHSYAGIGIALGGSFTGVGGQQINNLAWVAHPKLLPVEVIYEPYAFQTLGERLIVGGYGAQAQPPASSNYMDTVLAWNGLTFASVGGGVNGFVLGMASRAENINVNSLAAGGYFSMAGSVAANNVALYTENNATQTGTWSAMGSGFNDGVSSMTLFRNNYVAGGEFTHSGATLVNGIARWNGSAWTPLTTGVVDGSFRGEVFAMTTRVTGNISNLQHQLIVGGKFATAGGVAARNVAAWFENTVNHPLNGWITFGSGFNGRVFALTMHGGDIYAGGEFTQSGDGVTPLSRIARWNGSAWVQVGAGLPGTVAALISHNNVLYAAVNSLNGGLAKWDGTSWTIVNGGVQNANGFSQIFALGAFHDEIHVGGRFLTVNAGSLSTPNWARHFETGAPWIAVQPLSHSVSCGGNTSVSITPASGYTGLTFAWRRDGVPLNNGPTGHGSTLSGANAATLSITNFQADDQGQYDCVLANTCGSDTAFTAAIMLNNGSLCCHADVNGDDVVNVNDLLTVINFWGPCPGGCDADIAPPGGDGAVNVNDLLAVINSWGSCP